MESFFFTFLICQKMLRLYVLEMAKNDSWDQENLIFLYIYNISWNGLHLKGIIQEYYPKTSWDDLRHNYCKSKKHFIRFEPSV